MYMYKIFRWCIDKLFSKDAAKNELLRVLGEASSSSSDEDDEEEEDIGEGESVCSSVHMLRVICVSPL